MKLSSSHLAWDYYHEFICIGINSFASFAAIMPRGCTWESLRSVWVESIRPVISERARERERNRKRAQTVKLLPISSWGKVTYRKSRRVNERNSANQIAYFNHLGNIQRLIKHPVLRPQFHILSCKSLIPAEALQITMSGVIMVNVSSQMYH